MTTIRFNGMEALLPPRRRSPALARALARMEVTRRPPPKEQLPFVFLPPDTGGRAATPIAIDPNPPDAGPSPDVRPGFKLFPYQAQGAAWLSDKKGAILADEMGVGKTATAIEWAKTKRPCLIVGPASVVLNWADRELKEFWRRNDSVLVLEGDTVFPKTLPDWTVCSYGQLPRFVTQIKRAGFQSMMIDEAHYIRNWTTEQTQNVLEVIEPRHPTPQDRPPPYRLAITGTPIVNSNLDAFPLLMFIGARERYEWKAWRLQNKPTSDEDDTLHARDIHKIMAPLMIRRMKAEVFPDLGPKTYTVLPVGLTNADEYEHAELQFRDWLRANFHPGAITTKLHAEAIVKMNHLRHLAAEGKVAPVADWLTSCGDGPPQKVIVFSTFVGPLEELRCRHPQALLYSGELSKEDRQSFVDRFQTDPGVCFFLGTYAAAGVGITLTAADRVVLLDLPWTPAARQQAEDRAHRFGQKRNVEIVNVVGKGTIDERMLEILNAKEVIIGSAVEGVATETARTTSIAGDVLRKIRTTPTLGQAPLTTARYLSDDAALAAWWRSPEYAPLEPQPTILRDAADDEAALVDTVVPPEFKHLKVQTRLVRPQGYNPEMDALPIYGPEDLQPFYRLMRGADREWLMAVFTDIQRRVVGVEVANIGDRNTSQVAADAIYRAAILANARNIFLAHNHPSGNCTPSNADEAVFHDMTRRCRIANIDTEDMMVVGSACDYSIKYSKSFPAPGGKEVPPENIIPPDIIIRPHRDPTMPPGAIPITGPDAVPVPVPARPRTPLPIFRPDQARPLAPSGPRVRPVQPKMFAQLMAQRQERLKPIRVGMRVRVRDFPHIGVVAAVNTYAGGTNDYTVVYPDGYRVTRDRSYLTIVADEEKRANPQGKLLQSRDIFGPVKTTAKYLAPKLLDSILGTLLGIGAARAVGLIGLAQPPIARDPWGSRCRDHRTGEWVPDELCGPVPTDCIVPRPAQPATTFALSADGSLRYEFVHKVLPAADLITSHDPFTFQVNDKFAQVIQPRLRDRAAAELQVRKIALNLSPELLLTDFHAFDRGAPIIGPDRLVESGNGRVMGIKRAIVDHPQVYARYRAMLLERVETFGLSKRDAEATTNPILVRERVTVLTPAERIAFVQDANTAPGISRSAIEQARTDAEKITLAMLEALDVREGESLFDALRAARNNGFVRAFLDTLPQNEQAQLLDAKGVINLDGVRRTSNAIFVSAFGAGEAALRLGEMAFESVDLDVKNVFNGLARAVGLLASSEGLVRSQQRPADLSLTGDLAATIAVYAKIKSTGLTVAGYLGQQQLGSRELTPFQEQVLRDLSDNIRSAKNLGAMFRHYAELVIAQPPPGQGELFGPVDRPGKETLWAQAVKNRAVDLVLRQHRRIARAAAAKVNWGNVPEDGQLRIMAWRPLRDLIYTGLGQKLRVEVQVYGFGGDQYQLTIGAQSNGRTHPVEAHQAALLRKAADYLGRAAREVRDFSGRTLVWEVTLPQEAGGPLTLTPQLPDPEKRRADPGQQPSLFQEFKAGDRVLYQDEEWEVGFVNNTTTGWAGTLRLQKSGDAGARQINHVPAGDVTFLGPPRSLPPCPVEPVQPRLFQQCNAPFHVTGNSVATPVSDPAVSGTDNAQGRPGRPATGLNSAPINFRIPIPEYRRAQDIAAKGDYPGTEPGPNHNLVRAVNAWARERILANILDADQKAARRRSLGEDAAGGDLNQIGPPAWAALHQWAREFKAQVGNSCGCGTTAVNVTNAFHDAVNRELGKPVRDPENLARIAAWFAQSAPRQGRKMRTNGQNLVTLPDVETAITQLLKEQRETIINLT